MERATERESERERTHACIRTIVAKRSRKFHLNRAGVYRSPAELATIVNKVHVLLGSELRSLLNYGRVIRGVYPGLLCHDDIAKCRRITANPRRFSPSLPPSLSFHPADSCTRFTRKRGLTISPPIVRNPALPSPSIRPSSIRSPESKKGSLFPRPRSFSCFFCLFPPRFLCRSSSISRLSTLVFLIFLDRFFCRYTCLG